MAQLAQKVKFADKISQRNFYTQSWKRQKYNMARATQSSQSENGTKVPMPAPTTSSYQAKPTQVVDYRVSLFDAMKFWGPAPELVNGRLAMLGFVFGVMGEMTNAETLLEQMGKLQVSTLLWLLLLVYASLVPILKGAKMEAFGPFTPRAETTNGRAAMLGFAVIMFLEYKAGLPFF